MELYQAYGDDALRSQYGVLIVPCLENETSSSRLNPILDLLKPRSSAYSACTMKGRATSIHMSISLRHHKCNPSSASCDTFETIFAP